jgi:superfamily I DNA and/or RNA helicase
MSRAHYSTLLDSFPTLSTLKHVRCKVVICEEAGEVMEPHMLSVLLPSVEHFIQIGDHQQLRAKVNNHSLSLESRQGALYQLNRSRFERARLESPEDHDSR